MADHRIPGESIYEGMVMEGGVTRENVEKVRNFSPVEGDILIATYPKTGTTWMSEIVSVLAAGGVDTDVMSKIQMERVLFLEMKYPTYGADRAGVDVLETSKRPGLMKTHLHAGFYEKQIDAGIKIILVIRNPKDTLVSYYNFYKNQTFLGNFPGSFSDFFELYKAKRIVYGDYFDWYESWLPHLDKPNVLLVSYEEMKQDIQGVISRVSKFTGKEITSDQMSTIVDHTSIENMQASKIVNLKHLPKFFGKGQVGGWKKYFSSEQSRHVDKEYKNKLERKGLNLLFEL